MSRPEDALVDLAERLRAEDSVISAHVRDRDELQELPPPAYGLLAAAGPRAAQAPAEYAAVVESVREGYLLHYGHPRLLAGADSDLALLAGDYLYALGLERLAAMGDLSAVRELADLISLAAQIHGDDPEPETAEPLWEACVVAIAAGASEAHEQAKAMLRKGQPDAAARLAVAARDSASRAGMGDVLGRTRDAIDFRAGGLPAQ